MDVQAKSELMPVDISILSILAYNLVGFHRSAFLHWGTDLLQKTRNVYDRAAHPPNIRPYPLLLQFSIQLIFMILFSFPILPTFALNCPISRNCNSPKGQTDSA